MNNNIIKLSSKGSFYIRELKIIIFCLILGCLFQFFSHGNYLNIFLPLMFYLSSSVFVKNIISIEYIKQKNEIVVIYLNFPFIINKKEDIFKLKKIDFKKNVIRGRGMTDVLYINNLQISFSQFYGIEHKDFKLFYTKLQESLNQLPS